MEDSTDSAPQGRGLHPEGGRGSRRCDNCNARLRGRFCTRCGQQDRQFDRVVCDNCGAEKQGHYCAVCGQSDRNYRRNALHLVGQALSETFELDSRLLKTLPKLLIRPGFLSVEFSRNRRANYLSPLRLYLFTSLAFFFVLSVSIDFPDMASPARDVARTGAEPASITFGETDGTQPWLQIDFDDDAGVEGNAVEGDDAHPAAPASVESGHSPPWRLTDWQREAFDRVAPAIDEERRRKLMEILRSSVTGNAMALAIQGIKAQDVADADTAERYAFGQLIDIMHQPLDAIRAWVENLPVAMFLLLPLFALLLKAFYPSRKWFYSEHLVFAMHNHTVAFLAFTVIALLPEGRTLADTTAQALVLALPLYYFIAMRRFYGGSRRATAFKFLALLLLYGLLLLTALLGAAAAVLVFF